MKCSTTAALLAFAAGALAQSGYAYGSSSVVQYTTIWDTVLTTVCPAPTQFVQNSRTYTVTEATTMTITDCPCSMVVPVSSAVPYYSPVASPTTAAAYTSQAPEPAPAPAPEQTYAPAGTGAYTAPPSTFTGAAANAKAGLSIAGLAGAAALAFAL